MHIRPATIEDCDDIGLVIVTAFWATFLGRVPEDCFDFSWTPAVSAAGWRRGFADLTRSHQLFYVAEKGGRVIGFVRAEAGAHCEGLAWQVNALFVLPTKQRQGIGRALLAHVTQVLSAKGISSLEIACVKENPNCGFYQHLGGVEMGRRPNKVDRYETEEILFGWVDIGQLLG